MRQFAFKRPGNRLAAALWACTAVFAAYAPELQARQASSSLTVSVSLVKGASQRGDDPDRRLCRTTPGGAFGATVTVVCSTGALVDLSPGRSSGLMLTHGGAYRYLTQVTWADQLWGTVDTYLGAGTVSSWRVVNLAHRRYLELTVGW